MGRDVGLLMDHVGDVRHMQVVRAHHRVSPAGKRAG
jgi:hypothetical protein